ncbi:hypothetical protein ECO9553_06413 [Escherichia coli O111:H11 str. CVM9553]|nr:hypothetical protein ECO9553_06413 [Escherichia coli O111:H11 str. CVM9553]
MLFIERLIYAGNTEKCIVFQEVFLSEHIFAHNNRIIQSHNFKKYFIYITILFTTDIFTKRIKAKFNMFIIR